ncbi:penicillin-binding transpeptidase domain-containing protein [Streptomyces sp. NPDC003362]
MPTARPSAQGLGDIAVAGRPVTGSEPSGAKKIPFQRTYTDGALNAPVTGYRSLAFGRSGLEAVYDSDLFRGSDVVTTIEPAAQKAAFTALGDDEGADVALDASTGDLLAVVSTPSYDPVGFSGRLPADAEAWRELNQDSRRPLRDRALRDATAPGGTFDVVIAAAALEHGLYRSADEPTRTGGSGDCAGACIRPARSVRRRAPSDSTTANSSSRSVPRCCPPSARRTCGSRPRTRTPLSWSLAYARTDDGRMVALAARIAHADPAAAARVTGREGFPAPREAHQRE